MVADYTFLENAVQQDAALRRVQRLQPVGGSGDKIFPPTYPPEQGSRSNLPRHVFERRRVGDEDIWCVLVDSVQSQANRLEESLLLAVEQGDMPLPYVKVDFSDEGLEPLERITSLDAPHRVYDAIFRDSMLNGEPFMQSKAGKSLAQATLSDATALLELSPTSLLFGAWHSQGEGGGLGAKFPRVLVSEIMGINTPVEEIPDQTTGEIVSRTAGRRTGSRIDPLGILRKVDVYKDTSDWDVDKDALDKKAKKVRPSEILHGNIAPTVAPLGVTCAYVEHRTVISLAGIRRLCFGSSERNVAGRALIAALGLWSLSEHEKRGYALRSRCDLVCDGQAPLELVHADGSVAQIALNGADAQSLYKEAYEHAEKAGFKFQLLELKPQKKLVEIIRSSRELALEGAGGEEDD